jgi:hypothetical protein
MFRGFLPLSQSFPRHHMFFQPLGNSAPPEHLGPLFNGKYVASSPRQSRMTIVSEKQNVIHEFMRVSRQETRPLPVRHVMWDVRLFLSVKGNEGARMTRHSSAPTHHHVLIQN